MLEIAGGIIIAVVVLAIVHALMDDGYRWF